MIVSRTPHRISFFGGGTDYPAYYREHGGRVLGATINKYSYISVRRLPPFFDHKHHIVYSKQENVADIDEIQHPSVRETFRFLKIEYGVSLNHDGDIPARSGMGSSSAFTVGLLNALYALEGKRVSKEVLTTQAIDIEQNWIKENVGSQDQVFAAHGGLNQIEFLSSGKIIVTPIILTQERLHRFGDKFLLYFTGLSRTASDIAAEQIQKTQANRSDLDTMKSLVDEACNILNSNAPLSDFGKLLDDTWQIKRRLSTRISDEQIDSMYERARKAGALGGKLLGAGGGGFMVFYVEEDYAAPYAARSRTISRCRFVSIGADRASSCTSRTTRRSNVFSV